MTSRQAQYLLWDPGRDETLEALLSPAGSAAWAEALRRLVDFAARFGLHGNLLTARAAFWLMTDENAYARTRAAGAQTGSLEALALEDLRLLKSRMRATLSGDFPQSLRHFSPGDGAHSIGLRIAALQYELESGEDETAWLRALDKWYRIRGCGIFSLADACRVEETDWRLAPIANLAETTFDDLIGLESQKERMRENVEAFLAGAPFNHMLLYGDAGTGKSTSVKALLNAYQDRGLRLVELRKEQLAGLPAVARKLSDIPLRFLLFIDDLSFEENETGYKYLKAAIEGGIEEMPGNVMLVATSNRRHLIRETWKDRSDMEYDGDVHRSDTMEEKLSLAARFGCSINFSAPDRKTYHRIVRGLAERAGGIDMTDQQLTVAANAWEIRHGGVSGRTARQFVNHLKGGKQAQREQSR